MTVRISSWNLENKVPNRLAHENSPYLLQHQNNPVDWYPWGPEALEKAKREDKPIFLSIGYAACHWCHVMEHESFEDPRTAALMNEHFVSIKVDREERPDLDGIYMQAVVAMTGQGGWPMSVFLTPDGEPFYGGTYFPPVRRYNMPSFTELLTAIANTWQHDRQRALKSGEQLRAHLQQEIRPAPATVTLSAETLDKAAMGLAQNYDWQNGGWGPAPKFPQPMTVDFLLSRATRGDKFALEIATHALDAMARGGMYDVVGGGFARYSVDAHWLVPHFEKMLYDNAQLARVYLHAYLITKNPFYRRITEETLDFVARELTHPDGGFYSSLDADSEGEEGKFYIWTLKEIREVLQKDANFFIAAYHLTEGGNFEGHTVLQRALSDEALAAQFDLPLEKVLPRLQTAHAQLLARRAERVRPHTDDKILTAWNGLMLIAFAEAGRYLHRADYTSQALRNADFLLTQLHPTDRLLRSWRAGAAKHNAYLEDYAALILGLLALYQTNPNPRWFAEAARLAQDMLAHFSDPNGGFFDTRDDHETLIVRPKDVQDNATPSGSALAVTALLQLAAFTGNGDWRDVAERALGGVQSVLARYPTAFAQWLFGLDFALGPGQEIAIVGPPPARDALAEVLWGRYNPRQVVAISDGNPNGSPPSGSPSLLDARPLLNNLPTAYVCEHFVCQQPVTTPKALEKLLNRSE
ncbi:MAG: thioredoxin domain-containing protein [Anaerolineales bacterium]|nr:thioredoxin domain-containing protein [Anaerolineales bacterium]